MAMKRVCEGSVKRTAAKAAMGVFALLCGGMAVAHAIMTDAQQNFARDIKRGAYLARAGDCTACHTAAGPGQAPFAGGVPINSPFGVIYSTNITPDSTYGIGRYSLEDFSRAVRRGIARDGRRLYPAMPYPSFTRISDEDIRALYTYFMHEVTPVNHQPPETRLPFPFNQRWSLIFWDFAFVDHQRFQPHPDRDPQWNRGAYLVQSLGHCGACHTPRGFAFQEKAYSEASPLYLSGATVDNWYAGNLRGDSADGLGRWSEAEIATFLESGHGGRMAAFGSMIEVIENSTQYLHKDDLQAIAHYLKSLPARGGAGAYNPDAPAAAAMSAALVSGEVERPGAGLYQNFCVKCHQFTGAGEAGKYPKLAGNSSVLAEDPTGLIRLLLQGSETARTEDRPKSEKMASFATKFTDRQIAEVLSFIRNSWGNHASPVTERQVALLRRTLQKQP